MGCDYCNNTGFHSRIGIFETLDVTDEIRELIVRGASSMEIRQKSIRNRIQTTSSRWNQKSYRRCYNSRRIKQKNINVLKERKEKLMVNMDEILELVVKKDASDVHLICGNKPVLRIARELTVVDEMEVLTPEDMNEIYDYLIRGNLDKDSVFRETRKLDTSYEFKNVRFRVNISNSFDIPVYTLRLIKK